MYGPKVDMIELWPEGTCGAQDAVYNTCGPVSGPTAYHVYRRGKIHILTIK